MYQSVSTNGIEFLISGRIRLLHVRSFARLRIPSFVFARNMLHAATWQRGNAMCLPVAVLAVQKHSISLIYTSEAVRAQPRSKILSPALFLHSHSLSFAPRTLCPFV